MTYRWSVWRDDGRRAWFPTFEAAERYARAYVAQSAADKFSRRAEIHDGMGSVARSVAEVRLDGANRVWTDIGYYSEGLSV